MWSLYYFIVVDKPVLHQYEYLCIHSKIKLRVFLFLFCDRTELYTLSLSHVLIIVTLEFFFDKISHRTTFKSNHIFGKWWPFYVFM